MKKKVIIICIIAIAVIGLGIGSFLLIKYFSDKTIEGESNKKPEVASIIIFDINPSIKVSLDKDDKVISMEALNDDAKDIIYEDCEGNDLDYLIYKLVNNLVDNGYTENKIVILVSTDGDLKTDKVESILKNELTLKNIENEILVLEDISEDAKKKAEEYGISESKASFIEEIISNNDNLTFDDLKDKSIDELNEIKNKPIEEEKKEEPKKEEKTNTGSNSSSNNSGSSSSNTGNSTPRKTYTCTPPSDLKSEEWCDWLSKRPHSCEFYLDEVSSDTMTPKVLSYLGITDTYSLYGNYATNAVYKGASYCTAYKSVVTTPEYKYTTYWDSHTGEFLSETKEAVPAFIMNKDQALAKGLEYYNLKEEDCRVCWVVAGIDRSNGPDEYYRLQVNMDMNNGKSYSVDYNAVTGSIESTRQW